MAQVKRLKWTWFLTLMFSWQGVSYGAQPSGSSTEEGVLTRVISVKAKTTGRETVLTVKGNGRIPEFTWETFADPPRIVVNLLCASQGFESRSIALESPNLDKVRIGAMEQLRIYAGILGIPCFPAFCRKDLLYALRNLSNRDVVLIDTAGQSHYDRERIDALRGLIPAEAPVDCHLLLPVGTSDGEMDQTARSFNVFGFKSYIFTKLDECRKRGSMLNQVLRLPLPVSYVTTGQNVPEDIEKADKGKLLNLILNGN